MTAARANKREIKQKGRKWVWQLDLARYDSRGVLNQGERDAIRAVLRGPGRQQFACDPWRTMLHRLLEPISDALDITGAEETVRGTAVGILLREMLRHNCSIWKWEEHHWEGLLRISMGSYCRVQGVQAHSRPHLMALAILLQRIRDPRCFGEFDRTGLAKKVFGDAAVEEAVKRVAEMLIKWGFSATLNDTRQRTALCDALLVNGSPFLEDLTMEALEEAYNGHTTAERRRSLQRLSNALCALGLIRSPLRHGFMEARGGKRNDITVGISSKWIRAIERWRSTSTLSPRTRAEVFYIVLKIGRWITTKHPAEVSPESWTRETAARCVAEVCRMSVGQWSNQVRVQYYPKRPLMPRAVNGHLQAIRFFFRDCQEWGWLARKFDPNRCLRTPSSVKRLIGPDPRIVADDIWAKLVWAGLNLNEVDLPYTGHGRFLYPFQMVRALTVVWLFTGLRADEMLRLRVGSIRWDRLSKEESGNAETRTCLLNVPVNKTGTAFVKPVDSIVGREIEAWEKVRPEQPVLLDQKTGELVHFLFVYRTRRFSPRYLNRTLIPALCKKAGVPRADARGAITCHRARATIASQLYNAREPLSLFELQEWLGHRSPQSTQSYAKISPTKLVKSYNAAGYFERNLRTIEVLVDQRAVRNGLAGNTPWKYYDLGYGYCTYDFFDQCPHRMACAKCSFYQPKDSTAAFLLEGKNNLLRMRQEIPLGESEIAALDDGISALQSLLGRLANVPTPAGPTPLQLRGDSLVQIQLEASDD
jgi:integrase